MVRQRKKKPTAETESNATDASLNELYESQTVKPTDLDDLPLPPSMAAAVSASAVGIKKKKKKKKVKVEEVSSDDDCCGDAPVPRSSAGGDKGIKTAPLVLLVLLTGTALLPALLWAGDKAGEIMSKNHLMGNIGFRLGLGPTPKKRVLSFYEKHDPDKIDDVSKILSKYYGNYPKLTKNLERKYQDYGYFLNWQQDEAPAVLVKEKLEIYYKAVNKKWHKHAPTHMKTAARNMYYNFSYLKRKSRIAWKKHIWPVLEPIFGVPKGAAEQKKKDARGGNKKKGRRHEFRDEPDDDLF